MRLPSVILGRLAAVALAAAAPVLAAGSPEATPPPPSPDLEPATAGRVLEAVQRSGAQAVLVNVWATWCAPCREEMPDLLRLRGEYDPSSFRLILVSADFPDQREAARRFLGALGVDFPSFIKKGDDMAFIDAMNPKWTGALPASFLYDGDGTLREFWEGRSSYRTMHDKILGLVQPDTPSTPEKEGS